MEKEYNSKNFDKHLDRFIRAMMSPEEETSFLAFLQENQEFAGKAYLTVSMIKEIRRSSEDSDRKIADYFHP